MERAFFISDPRNPGKLYLVTAPARHVLFNRDDNELYRHHNHNHPCRNVLVFADAAIEKHIKAIESEIGKKRLIIKHLERRLVRAEQTRMNEEHAKAERKYIPSQLEEASEAIGALETLLANVSRDWT
jgi:hypothetical protein